MKNTEKPGKSRKNTKMSPRNLRFEKVVKIVKKHQPFDDFATFHWDWQALFSHPVQLSGPWYHFCVQWCQNCQNVNIPWGLQGVLSRNVENSVFFSVCFFCQSSVYQTRDSPEETSVLNRHPVRIFCCALGILEGEKFIFVKLLLPKGDQKN